MSSSSETDPETDALARYILRSLDLAPDGRPMERCKLSSIPQATVKAVM
jgi:hypothetical protein